ncbi:MAG: hypothetical protein P8J89_10320 [Phycisphaerales bacterium]|nr:hypothetical protein [Phycisphaerales bacterium]
MKLLLAILIPAALVCLTGCEASRSLKTAQKAHALKPVSNVEPNSQSDRDQPMAEASLAQSQARVDVGQ